MCGELKDTQFAETLTVRATGSFNNLVVNLPKQFQNVEEIWLDEYFFVGVGASGVTYLDLKHQDLTRLAINNDNAVGTALGLDSVNIHVIHTRPRVLVKAHGATLNRFVVSMGSAAGVPTTFTEGLLVLTVVMHRPAFDNSELRLAAARVEWPQQAGPDPRTTYQGSKQF